MCIYYYFDDDNDGDDRIVAIIIMMSYYTHTSLPLPTVLSTVCCVYSWMLCAVWMSNRQTSPLTHKFINFITTNSYKISFKTALSLNVFVLGWNGHENRKKHHLKCLTNQTLPFNFTIRMKKLKLFAVSDQLNESNWFCLRQKIVYSQLKTK